MCAGEHRCDLQWSKSVRQADADILQSILDGDARTLAAVLGQLESYVTRTFGGYYWAEDDAPDIAVVALMRALHKRDGYHGRAPVMAWLCRFAKNVGLEHAKKRKRLKSSPMELEHEQIADERPNPEQVLVASEEEELERGYAAEALGSLSEREREAVEMVDIVGMSVKAFAEARSSTEDAVSSLLRRARQKMRSKLMGVAW